jgi:hypothetical protein
MFVVGDCSPGPAAYSSLGMTVRIMQRAPAYSLGARWHETGKPSHGKITHPDEIPGPSYCNYVLNS